MKPFNKIRVAYLEDMINDPAVMGSIDNFHIISGEQNLNDSLGEILKNEVGQQYQYNSISPTTKKTVEGPLLSKYEFRSYLPLGEKVTRFFIADQLGSNDNWGFPDFLNNTDSIEIDKLNKVINWKR